MVAPGSTSTSTLPAPACSRSRANNLAVTRTATFMRPLFARCRREDVHLLAGVQRALDGAACTFRAAVPEGDQHVGKTDQPPVARRRAVAVVQLVEPGTENLDGKPTPAGRPRRRRVDSAGTAGDEAAAGGQSAHVILDAAEFGVATAADDGHPHQQVLSRGGAGRTTR